MMTMAWGLDTMKDRREAMKLVMMMMAVEEGVAVGVTSGTNVVGEEEETEEEEVEEEEDVDEKLHSLPIE